MFKLRVDTGGTFTDCWGLEEGQATPRLAKVLSSGRLRVSVARRISETELEVKIPDNWNIPNSFFTGYKAEARGKRALILSFDTKKSRLILSNSIPNSEAIDLFTREEAPVIGARLLTGTKLDEPFPPLDFRLATTRGTNALLERKGARIVFFVTKGFGDLLTIKDQRRSDLFALRHHRSDPLFEEAVEVQERISALGEVLAPLEISDAFRKKTKSLVEDGVQVAAVALLHSYANPEHETALQDFLIEQGFSHVSISSKLAPLIKILPRAETAVTNAYLQPIMQSFLDHIHSRLGEGGEFLTMTSAGGLETTTDYQPKDSLLSGPAGGVSGAAAIAEELGFTKILTFDMGGTSTDVARYDNGFQYQFEQSVGDARLFSPSLKIETVAAGGGSICAFENGRLKVGPESAGASPGPACYGQGGPLTITDVNLLLGRIDPENFGIPLSGENFRAARTAARTLQKEAGVEDANLDDNFLEGLVDIAVEQMADAIRTISIRDGADPTEYALLAFGGAGPLHACDIAERLGIETVIIPGEAGVLSAYGLDKASVERFAERQFNLLLPDPDLKTGFQQVDEAALTNLKNTGFSGQTIRRIAEVRLQGQDSTLSLEVKSENELVSIFREEYKTVFGYEPDHSRALELVSYRSIAGTGRPPAKNSDSTGLGHAPNPVGSGDFIDRSQVTVGESVSGPAVIQDPFSTLYVKSGWNAAPTPNASLILRNTLLEKEESLTRPEAIIQELFQHRFDNLVVEMGTMLQRSSISTNVKERADFSCALLDASGELISSAPHIPVHLGALGLCVRMVSREINLHRGDTIVTNHPGVGGSHLPDVTVITPVFAERKESPVAFIANRAHHAEIGGITPGSMPPTARNLAEEGVVISPRHLIKEGVSQFAEIRNHLENAPYPTRNSKDNLADLHAQVAANKRGEGILLALLEKHGEEALGKQFALTKQRSEATLRNHLATTGFHSGFATEHLDDGTRISVSLKSTDAGLAISFAGTEATHPGNLNATPAIVQSAVLYVLRLWTQSRAPLNEGLLHSVEIDLPHSFLNPAFEDDATKCPAVVGGNVETSQRVVDALLKALGIQACSQGTMNNFLFGNDQFGYYETICGGTGAGRGYHGTDAIHSHMTNTAITDPEILEHRYPIRLRQFSIRDSSGGKGTWRGGNGVIREFEFLEPLEISLLTQHRKEAPYSLDGGEPGVCGRQRLNGLDMEGIASFRATAGDVLRLETPGGGGCGSSGSDSN